VRILFVTMFPIEQGASGLTSPSASTRYRVLIPTLQLTRMGRFVQIAVVPPEPGAAKALRELACDVMVLSKAYYPEHVALARQMRARGVKVVADFCDDHFAHPDIAPVFRELALEADALVASTPAMAAVLRRNVGRDAAVVVDPVEMPRGEPRFQPRFPALRLAWFGHPLNLDGLAAKRSELHAVAERYPVHLAVVTSPLADARDVVAQLAHPNVTITPTEWSLEATRQAIDAADAVWIPVSGAAGKEVKSPNRLIEPLWRGRLVIADAVPSYEPFADLVPVGKGLQAGLESALADPAGVERNLREAQRRIARGHSALACARQWLAALGDASPAPMKLNLGCGDKILPGYVNVDVVEARAGARPDVVCDLHDLAPFEDDSADEILSVHVVEHFWRWEIEAVLREWVRVLKPGGRMVVECPNLQSACETFLQDPQRFSRQDQEGQRTMWVFYGDPKWQDPLMIHRWGYTPESLRALLEGVGLRDVRQEPAQFKLREPRDMRITGMKP
jgi:SAM-dependent methyltransferase